MSKLPTLKKRNSSVKSVQRLCFEGAIQTDSFYQDLSNQKHIRLKDPIKLLKEEGAWNIYWQKKYLLGTLPSNVYSSVEIVLEKGDKLEGRISKVANPIHISLYHIS